MTVHIPITSTIIASIPNVIARPATKDCGSPCARRRARQSSPALGAGFEVGA
jgi:hypothetical protein